MQNVLNKPFCFLLVKILGLGLPNFCWPEELKRTGFDTERYLQENPDVKVAKLDPVWHWLNAGIWEGRPFPGDYEFRVGPFSESRQDIEGWRAFTWKGRQVALRKSPFIEYVRTAFDAERYLQDNPDVGAAKWDPVWHWLNAWLWERRPFPGDYEFRIGPFSESGQDIEGWRVFTWKGHQVAFGQNPLIEYVRTDFDAERYFQENPDVGVAKLDPVWHWLNAGIWEGRPFPGDYEFRVGPFFETGQDVEGWQVFAWKDRLIRVKKKWKPSPTILRQIMDQARHEPAILAPGVWAIRNLRYAEGSDLEKRLSITNIPGMVGAVKVRPSTMVIIPYLAIGGAEKYANNIVEELLTNFLGPVLIICTLQTKEEACEWEWFRFLPSVRKCNIIFWKDHAKNKIDHDVAYFSRFLYAIRPDRIIVLNSQLGLESVSRYGKAMSHIARIYCFYFSMGVGSLNVVSYGARYPRKTTPFAMTVTDNEPMATTMRFLHGSQPGPGVFVLPPKLHPAEENVFMRRLNNRRRTMSEFQDRQRKWVWISRVDPLKGVEILKMIALMRPNWRFDVYGPVEPGCEKIENSCENINHVGTLSDILEYDFSDYDGFLFTSLFEGMPNIVLEMTQHAIPIVASKVGGLGYTFSEGVIFVEHEETFFDTARKFCEAMDGIYKMSLEDFMSMVIKADQEAKAKHSPDIYNHAFKELFFS